MLPELGRSKPKSMESVVVLPAPFPPNKAVMDDLSKEKERLSTAFTPRKALVRDWVWRIGFKEFSYDH